jgi:hypothetical protein
VVRAVRALNVDAEAVHPRDAGVLDVNMRRAIVMLDNGDFLVALACQLRLLLLQSGEDPGRGRREAPSIPPNGPMRVCPKA